MAKYARTTAKPDAQFVYEQSARNQRQYALESAQRMTQRNHATVPLFARGYLLLWALYAAIALPFAWYVGKYAATSWLLPGSPELAIGLALISGVFGRRNASTEAMTIAFLGAFAFGSGLERGVFGLSGLAVALLGGFLLAMLVGAGVWAFINATGEQNGLIDPNDPESVPESLPIAWRSMLTHWANKEHKLRRALLVIGPMLALGVIFHSITLLANWLMGPGNLFETDGFQIALRVLAGLISGGTLGWLLQQFIPDRAPKTRTAVIV